MPDLSALDVVITPELLAAGMSLWAPFAGQRVTVTEIAADWSFAEVTMELTEDNSNAFGTAFGGTMFAMVDPFAPILVSQQLGDDYQVWDSRAEIEFVKPGRSDLRARIEVPVADVEEIREAASGGDKVLRWFEVSVLDADDDVVALQRRQVYVRRKRR